MFSPNNLDKTYWISCFRGQREVVVASFLKMSGLNISVLPWRFSMGLGSSYSSHPALSLLSSLPPKYSSSRFGMPE